MFTDEESHNREMNINAHFAWALAMWGSGEQARKQENYICAATAYYYTLFHVGFAWISSDHTFHQEDTVRIHHNKVETWVEGKIPVALQIEWSKLRQVRETINYLGMGTPSRKLGFVRGRGLYFGEPEKYNISFFDLVNESSDSARNIIRYVHAQIETECHKYGWVFAKRGDDLWVEEYLQEDAFLQIFPDTLNGRELVKSALSILDE